MASIDFTKRKIALAVGCVLAGTMFSVSAQEQQEEGEEAEEQQAERIQVLGSRIRSDGLDEATPVQVINAGDAITQGFTNLGDLLRSSTIAAGANQVTAEASTAFVTAGGVGTESLSLRGLGANRTLVLLNGRRIGPAGTRGQVAAFDMNILPLAAIDRIEILKDGASSLYGSDAVAGVVNIVTKEGDEGSLNLNMSQPSESGGESLRANGTFGRSFDNWAFRVVGDYNKRNELQRGDRSFLDCAQSYVFDPDTGERADVVDPRTGDYHCNDLLWGHVWIYDYAESVSGSTNVPTRAKAQFDYDGDLANYIPGFDPDPDNPAHMRTPEGWFPVAYDATSQGVTNASHPFQSLVSLGPEQETMTLFGGAEYWVNPDFTLYSEVLMNRRETTTNGYRQFWSYMYNEDFFAGNSMSEGWTGAQWLSPTPITDHSGSNIVVDYRRLMVGADGYLGNGRWFWDISYQDSLSDGDYTSKLIYEDAISPYNFTSGSCEGEITPVREVPCIDVPWLDPQFLAGDISDEVRAFLFGQETGNTEYTQRTVEASLSGELFSLPAGMVSTAFGVSYQRDEIIDTPGEVTLARNSWGQTAAGITEGAASTRAIFGELYLPLLRDVALVEELDLTVSARYTDVSSYGSDSTYKANINWLVGGGFRIRASQGTSFRSPALYELYLNNQTSFVGQRTIDPCINWGDGVADGSIDPIVAENCEADGIPADFAGGAITATVFTGGGAGSLEAETSIARTAGFVWLPDWTDFSLSVDYFEIEIDGEVTQLTAGQIVGQCYASESFSTEPLCDQFFRADDLRIEEVYSGYLNIAKQVNRGCRH